MKPDTLATICYLIGSLFFVLGSIILLVNKR